MSPDVEALWSRYKGYREGREPLAAMANFCLSVLEWRAGGGKNKRKEAAELYGIDKKILKGLGKLTSGDGRTARNFAGSVRPHTEAESAWIDAAVRAIIRRVGERAYDPDAPLRQMTMNDLPKLS